MAAPGRQMVSPHLEGFLNIHELTALELRDNLDSGELSSREVVQALIDRSRGVDPKVNGFVHRFWEQALAEASRCDEERERGQTRGPLHGIPISVKESIDTAGVPTSMGMVSLLSEPAATDAVVVKLARAQGAIVLGKTNVPQTLMLASETDNHIWGRSSNPWSLRHACGGSSGGEAVVLATGQSPLGLGSDLGGSLRLPAHFCGVASLKPTGFRWSTEGVVTALPGQELIRAQPGPMARTSKDLQFLFGALSTADMAKLDPAVAPLAGILDFQEDPKKLRVGVYTSDGVVTPSSAVARATKEAAAALEAAGVTVVPYTPPDAQEVPELLFSALAADGGETVAAMLQGETLIPQLQSIQRAMQLPGPVRSGLAWVTGAMGEPQASRLLSRLGKKPVAELWRLAARRTELRRAELRSWNEAKLDAVLCPPHATVACLHGDGALFAEASVYALRYNVLDFPAGVVPVTRVTNSEAAPTARGQQTRLVRKMEKVEQESAGLPVGVQVVTRPYQESLALHLMTLIETRMRTKESFPWTPVNPSALNG